MRELSRWLQTNPMVVLVMFVLSFTSGIAGLLLGWEQLYEDYLSKTVEIPMWLLLIALLILPGVHALARSVARGRVDQELMKVEGKQFGVQQIVLDGKIFERCEFHGTEVIFEGNNSFGLTNCEFYAPRFSFAKSAAITIDALTRMYADQGLRPLIDQTITNIQAGHHPQAVAPTVLG